MKSEVEMINRLYEIAEQFNKYANRGDWLSAKWCYDKASILTVELGIADEIKFKLFGNRAYVDREEDEVDGLFSEEKVIKVFDEYIKIEEARLQEERKRKKYIQECRKELRKKIGT